MTSQDDYIGLYFRLRQQLVVAFSECRQLYEFLECQQQRQRQQQQRIQREWRLPLIRIY